MLALKDLMPHHRQPAMVFLGRHMGSQSVTSLAWSGVPIALWIILSMMAASALRGHDAGQTDRARDAVLRHAIFLKAAEALVHLHLSLGRMGDAQSDECELWTSFDARLVKLMPVHMIATRRTVETVMGQVNEVAPAFRELAMLRRLRPE